MQQSKQSHRVHLAAGSEPPPSSSQTTVSSAEPVQLTDASIPP